MTDAPVQGQEIVAVRQAMTAKEGQEKATAHVLSHVERAKSSLLSFRSDNLSADGVFIHPSMQLVTALKVAREELNKAITLMESTKWRR